MAMTTRMTNKTKKYGIVDCFGCWAVINPAGFMLTTHDTWEEAKVSFETYRDMAATFCAGYGVTLEEWYNERGTEPII